MTDPIITAPGIYSGISMADYHNQLTPSPSISSSGLRTIETKSPEHFWEGSYLNPEREPIDTDALRLGKIAHAFVLGEDHFSELFAECPFNDWAVNEKVGGIEYKAKIPKGFDPETDAEPAGVRFKPLWKQEQLAAGKTIIMPKDRERAEAMAARIVKDQFVREGLFNGPIEQTIVWEDQETGVWLKARPDVIPHDSWYPDYKTIADLRAYKRSQAIMDYAIYQQAALVAEGLGALGQPIPTTYVLVFQEKTPPYAVIHEELDPELVARGIQINRRAIRKFAACLEQDEWPSMEQPRTPYRGPGYFHERCQQEEATGELPRLDGWAKQWLGGLPA